MFVTVNGTADTTTILIEKVVLSVSWFVLAALSFLLLLVLIGILVWYILKIWMESEHQFSDTSYFRSDFIWTYLLILYGSTVTFGTNIVTQGALLFYNFFQHIYLNWKTYLLLLVLGGIGYGISEYDDDILDGITVVWNEFFGIVLEVLFYPLLNGIRMTYDTVIPIWDSLVRLGYFITIRVLSIGVFCAVEEVIDLIVAASFTIAQFITTLVEWIVAGPLETYYYLEPVMQDIGFFATNLGDIVGCYCVDLENFYNLIISPLNDPKFQTGVTKIWNFLLQFFVQVPGLSIKNKAIPNFSESYRQLCHGLVDVGEAGDNFLNRTYTDIIALIQTDCVNCTLLGSNCPDFCFYVAPQLPQVFCVVTRPMCFIVEFANITTSFFTNIENLNPTNGNWTPVFEQWNETAICAGNAINFTREVFDMEAVPALDFAFLNLAVTTKYFIIGLGVIPKVLLDFITIIVIDIADIVNFFLSLQAYFEQGNLTPLFSSIDFVGLSLGNIMSLIYIPLQELVYALFLVLSTTLKFIFQFFFYINLIFSNDAYLRSPAMNETINEVFVSLAYVAQASGDFMRFVGTNVSYIEMNDLYDNAPYPISDPNFFVYTLTLEATEALYNQTGVYQNASDWVLEDCVYVTYFYEYSSVPYWGQFFCCFGDTISDGIGGIVLLFREGVTILQFIIPPDFGGEIEALNFYVEDMITALSNLFNDLGCVLGFIDFGGDMLCFIDDLEPDPITIIRTRSERLGSFIGQLLNVFLVPLRWLSTFLNIATNEFAGDLSACVNVSLTAPSFDQITSDTRYNCSAALVNVFFTGPVLNITNATVTLGTWFDCIPIGDEYSGLGAPFIDVAETIADLINDLQQAFIEFLLMVLDILSFFSTGRGDDLLAFFYDSAEFTLAFLKGILTFFWTDIIVPLLRDLLDFIYDICNLIQGVVNTICWKNIICKAPDLKCSDIYGSVVNTTKDPVVRVPDNATEFNFASPPPLPTNLSPNGFANVTAINEYIQSVAQQPSPTSSTTPSPSVTQIFSPSITPSVLSPAPKQLYAGGSQIYATRKKRDEIKDNPIYYEPNEDYGEEKGGRFERNPKRVGGSDSNERSEPAPYYKERETRLLNTEIDSTEKENEEDGKEDNDLISKFKDSRMSSPREVLGAIHRSNQDKKQIMSSEKQRIYEEFKRLRDQGRVPTLESEDYNQNYDENEDYYSYYQNFNTSTEYVRSYRNKSPPSSSSSSSSSSSWYQHVSNREFSKRNDYSAQDWIHTNRYEPIFFNHENFPNLKYVLTDMEGREIKTFDVTILHTFESRLNLRENFDRSSPLMKSLLFHSGNLMHHGKNILTKFHGELYRKNFYGSMKSFVQNFPKVLTAPSPKKGLEYVKSAFYNQMQNQHNKISRYTDGAFLSKHVHSPSSPHESLYSRALHNINQRKRDLSFDEEEEDFVVVDRDYEETSNLFQEKTSSFETRKETSKPSFSSPSKQLAFERKISQTKIRITNDDDDDKENRSFQSKPDNKKEEEDRRMHVSRGENNKDDELERNDLRSKIERENSRLERSWSNHLGQRLDLLKLGSSRWLNKVLPGAQSVSDIPPVVINILDDCFILAEFTQALLQQTCSIQRYFTPGSMYSYQLYAFMNYTIDPENYNGTTIPDQFVQDNCTYLNQFDQDVILVFNYTPNFPDYNIFTPNSAKNSTNNFCPTVDFSLNCEFRNFMYKLNVDLDNIVDDVANFFFKPSNDSSGFNYFLENFIFCNYGSNMECRNQSSLGFNEAFSIVYSTLILVSLISAFLWPIPPPFLGLAWMLSPLFLLVLGYSYSPFCFPALPYCFFDNIFDSIVDTFPPCLNVPSCLIKNETLAPPTNGSFIQTCNNITYYNAREDLGIIDAFDNLSIFLNAYAPNATEFIMTSKWTYWFYSIPFIQRHIDKYYFGGQGVPEQYVCYAWVTVLNIAILLLILALFLVLAFGIAIFLTRTLIFYLSDILLILFLLFMALMNEITQGFVEYRNRSRAVIPNGT